MSQNNTNDKATAMELIKKINAVPGFDPELFTEEYTDLSNGNTFKKLPVMTQMAWCRMKYPECKFAVTVTPAKDCFIAVARVYANYKDSPECYLAEASVSRGYNSEKPSISPREWAQTAALGMALRNAGFGLQFQMAGDDPEPVAFDELGVTRNQSSPVTPTNTLSEGNDLAAGNSGEEYSVATEPPKALTLEEKYNEAIKMPCPIQKFAGKTLFEVLMLDPGAIKWLAEKFEGNAEIKSAAQTILDYSLNNPQPVPTL